MYDQSRLHAEVKPDVVRLPRLWRVGKGIEPVSRFKINGWQRIGIIASVVFEIYALVAWPHNPDNLIGTLVMVFGAWAFVYLVLFLVRWVRRGFQP